MNIVVINGGARATSRTRGLALAFAHALTSRKVTVSYFDVGVDLLPIYTGSNDQQEIAAVKKLISFAEQADGFFICTPEYHSGMSGALKNALDFLGGKQFNGKPVVIGAAAGGGKGGMNALGNLRTVLRGVYALALPDQIVVDPDHFDEQLRLANQDVVDRLEMMADELVRVTGLIRGKGQKAIKIAFKFFM